ncbi:MAG: cytochrome b [Sphingomonadales bacterium]|nr:MAG: cytochrome b [Sphingomonadales bacterium]
MTPQTRYTQVAIILHWLIALGVIGLIVAGKWMAGAINRPETQALAYDVFQLHKSVGITVLLLTILRLAWRLGHRPPPLPDAMPGWQKAAATGAHWLFYLLLIGIPLSGWALVSASPLGLPTLLYGVVEWPHIAALTHVADRQATAHQLEEVHELLGNAMLLLVLLHVAAALKHQYLDRDNLLARMLPFLARG